VHPLIRASRHLSMADLAWSLPPLSLLPIARAALGRPQPVAESRPEDRDPEVVAAACEAIDWLGRWWFRHRTQGLEHVPARGPALLVANHNGGFMVSDGCFILAAVHSAHGPQRALYGLGHDLVHWLPRLLRTARALGVLRAGHAVAHEVFRRGDMLLVFPGGELDAFRPFSQRNRVRLAGRTGFVRLALREQVPILPVVTAGAHEQFVVLSSGERLARALGLPRRLRTGVLPLALSLPWGLTSGYLPYLPLPTQITTAFCAPLRWPDLGPEAADDVATVRRCYEQVEAVMQAKLDELTAGRVPWLGVRQEG
jgi:1-acyl-sn-glycerol-3-phosphate acyltransferase